MVDINYTPYDSPEYKVFSYWRDQAKRGELKTIPCIAGWSDICGSGRLLDKAHWSLQAAQDLDLFRALSQKYLVLGRPLITGVPPMPTERVLVINDGVARTIDLTDPAYIHQAHILFYVRDLLMYHYMLERQLVGYGLGLRTVLAGGQRCQYSPNSSTGQSLLYYTNEPSAFGKALLNQCFVNNPAEFQMNTAFALAYTLESLGTEKGIIPNRVYIEESWLEKLNAFMPEPSLLEQHEIHFMWQGEPGITIAFDDRREFLAKGFSFNVFRIQDFIVHKRFEGEMTEFPMSQHDRYHL